MLFTSETVRFGSKQTPGKLPKRSIIVPKLCVSEVNKPRKTSETVRFGSKQTPATVWEILLTHGLAVAEVGRGRGCVTPCLRVVQHLHLPQHYLPSPFLDFSFCLHGQTSEFYHYLRLYKL